MTTYVITPSNQSTVNPALKTFNVEITHGTQKISKMYVERLAVERWFREQLDKDAKITITVEPPVVVVNIRPGELL